MIPASVVAEAVRSLVAVTFRRLTQAAGSGSVIAHGEHYSDVVTAAHVVERRRVGVVTYRVDGEFHGAKFDVIKRDIPNDLALIRTRERLPVPAIPVAEKNPRLFSAAAIIGCPKGVRTYFGTASDCRITSVAGSNGDPCQHYQLSVPVGGGVSGGMLIDRSGALVGVVVSGDDEAFASFAVSLPILRAFVGLS